MKVAIDHEKVFPNGTYIFTAKGVQLSPQFGEGQRIAEILKGQNETRKANEEQKKKFERITGIDIDKDGIIG